MVIDGGNDHERQANGKAKQCGPATEAEAKRSCTDALLKGAQARVPPDMRIEPNSGGGNCLFYAIRDCLVAQGRSKREAAEIRVLAVTHLRTHSRHYSGYWKGDARSAEGEPMNTDFDAYLTALAKEGA